MALTQALLEQLPDGAEANVVNLIDQRVWNLTPNYTSYSVSKSALWALTRHLAVALAPRVRVNAIGPGPTLRHESMSRKRFDELCRAVPLGRATSPEEICAAVRFLTRHRRAPDPDPRSIRGSLTMPGHPVPPTH
jgi:NAD(P)-dependent dehydrogenase (short-subunit alcohol dehydrogenase family)